MKQNKDSSFIHNYTISFSNVYLQFLSYQTINYTFSIS